MSKSKKRKHTNNKSSNPLSQARGKDSAEAIWFRKTGMGYNCYVEYYSAQPLGIVANHESHPETPPSYRGNDEASQQQKERHGGLSRASKRRQKKRSRQGSDVIVETMTTMVTEPKRALTTTTTSPPGLSPLDGETKRDHPLLQSTNGSMFKYFFESMSKPLPLTFRIRETANPKMVNTFQEKLTQIPCSDLQCTDVILHGKSKKDKQMPVYQTSSCKSSLTSDVKDLLLEYSQNGTIARQELGSMLPVAMLQRSGYFKKGTKCLDMCASPGSKTLQALEVLSIASPKSKVFLVANDILQSRLDALHEAVKRSGMERIDEITYTCQDATKFELSRSVLDDSKLLSETILFDAILCDVPCSGDGTCRKDKHLLPQWTPVIGNQLHATQVRILTRAVELARPGGCICYSTCSLNPIENEAVVASVLHKFNQDGAMLSILECPDIPGLILRDGVTSWKVANYVDKSANDQSETASDDEGSAGHLLNWYNTYDDAVSMQPESRWLHSMWPSHGVERVKLSRCKRLWPQDQDSGGFFICLLHKSKIN